LKESAAVLAIGKIAHSKSTGPEAIAFKNQECPERQPDMGALCLGLATLTPLHLRDLFQAPVVLLDLSTCLGKFQPHQFIHLQIVSGAVTLGLFSPAKDS
jgi:hypothetical protein